MKRIAFLSVLLLGLTVAMDLESSLLGRSLNEIASLNTDQLSCATPQNQFNQMSNELLAWKDLLSHKNEIPQDIQTLTQIQELIKSSKPAPKKSKKRQMTLIELSNIGKQIESKLDNLKLPHNTKSKIAQPQLAEMKAQLKNLSSQDENERDQCCDRLLKMCEYLINQLTNLHTQCQSSPVTVIKIKGKIKDLQIVSSGCGGQQVTQVIGDTEKPENCVEPSQPEVVVPQPEIILPEPNYEVIDEVPFDEPAPEDPVPEEPVPEEPVPAEPTPEVPPVDEGQPEEPPVDAPVEVGEEPEVAPEEPEEPVEVEDPVPEVPEVGEEPVPEVPAGEEPEPEVPAGEEPVEIPAEEEQDVPEPVEPAGEEPVEPELVGEEDEPLVPEQGEEPVEHVDGEEPEPEVPAGEEPEVEVGEEPEPEVPAGEEPEPEVEFAEDPEPEVLVGEEPEPQGEDDAPVSPEPEPVGEEPEVHPAEHVDPVEPAGEEDEVPPVEEQPEEPFVAEDESEEPVLDEEQPEEPLVVETIPEPVGEEPEEATDGFEHSCVEGDAAFYTLGYNDEAPAFTHELTDVATQYGFGFWFRWLQYHPTPLYGGMANQKFFVARLTENNPHSDVELGDRNLALFVSPGGFQFSTYDVASENGNVFEDVAPEGSLEGEWGYVYFSYDGKAKKAVGFLHFEGHDQKVVQLEGVHNEVSYLKLVVGGREGNYPSFQGQIKGVRVNTGENSVITTLHQFQEYVLGCNPQPEEQFCSERVNVEVHGSEPHVYNSEDAFNPAQTVVNADDLLATEYSVSGWFKWSRPDDQTIWQTAFRFTVNDLDSNKNTGALGDRTLGLWVGGPQTHDILAFATYSFTDLNNNGNPNYWQSVPYDHELSAWHYVYFGYSKAQKRAYAYVKFATRESELVFVDVSHFVASKYYLSLGQDAFYRTYSGKIAQFYVNFCDAYRETGWDEPFGRVPEPVTALTPISVAPVVVPASPETDMCDDFIEVDGDNAADILCALSQYLGQIAIGENPEHGASHKVCFCLNVDVASASPEMLALAQMFPGPVVNRREPRIKALMSQPRKHRN